MLHYPFRQSRLKNHTPSARQSNDINPESNDRFGFNPNRPFERAVLHLMPFMTLSVRCHSLADTLPLFLFCRSPLRLQQTDNPSARPSNETDSESNDRFGLKTRCNAAMEGSWTTGTWTLFRRFPKGKEKETGNGGNPSAPIPNQRTTGGRLMRTARCSIMDGQAVCQIPIFLRMSLGMAFLLTM